MLTVLLVIVLILLLLPVAVFFVGAFILSRKPQHAIIRSHPYLGWVRYFLEKIGPEFRQYWFDSDGAGKPFSRAEFLGLVFAAKYRSDLISFGSRRDYDASGFYIANDMFPLLTEELQVNNMEDVDGKKYVIEHENLFSRREELQPDKSKRWLYGEEDAIVVGPDRRHPWRLLGMFGASATSYGAVGGTIFCRQVMAYKWPAVPGLIPEKAVWPLSIFRRESISWRKSDPVCLVIVTSMGTSHLTS